MCNNYQLMTYFGGLCISNQTGLSMGLWFHFFLVTRAVLRLVWPSILLQSARGLVATAAAMERHVCKIAYIII